MPALWFKITMNQSIAKSQHPSIHQSSQCQCFITAFIVNGPLIFRLHSTSRRSVHVIRENQNKTALRGLFLRNQFCSFFSTRVQIYDR